MLRIRALYVRFSSTQHGPFGKYDENFGPLTPQNAHNRKVAGFKGSGALSCSWSQAVKSPWKFQAGMPPPDKGLSSGSSTSWCVWLQCHLRATLTSPQPPRISVAIPGGQFCANTDVSTLAVTCSVTSTQAPSQGSPDLGTEGRGVSA